MAPVIRNGSSPLNWLGADKVRYYPLHLVSNKPANRLHGQNDQVGTRVCRTRACGWRVPLMRVRLCIALRICDITRRHCPKSGAGRYGSTVMVDLPAEHNQSKTKANCISRFIPMCWKDRAAQSRSVCWQMRCSSTMHSNKQQATTCAAHAVSLLENSNARG